MKRPQSQLVAIASALGFTVAAAGAQVAVQQPVAPAQTFRSQTELVVLHVNVFDGRSDAVPDLPQSAFSVFENDQPQNISFFSNADVPVAIGLLVDNSSSMIARRGLVVAGGTAFVDSSHPDDELFTIHLNENIRFGLPAGIPFTNRPLLLQAAFVKYRAGGRTAIHDAVIAGLDHLEGATHQKHVLVVLSDGDDNASTYSEADMLARARAGDTIIYTVSNAGHGQGEGDRGVLKRLAEATGGVAYFPRTDEEAVQRFGEIAGNIRRAYSLGYVPTNNTQGDYRRVRVTVRAPGRRNLNVQSRHGYTATGHSSPR